MARLLIYGDGGMGRELAIMAGSLVLRDDDIDSAAYMSDQPTYKEFAGYPVIRFEDSEPGDRFAVGVGDGSLRQRLAERCIDAGLVPIQLIADNVVVGPAVTAEPGLVMCPFTMVTASAQIGLQFQCNMYSYVAHDCVIGDYVTFAPRVCCNGNVHVGDHAYIGTGAVIKQGTADKPLRIGAHAVVGMGAVVTKDVPDGAVVVGNPARVMER